MPPLSPHIVVPRWHELPSGLLIPSSVADRIEIEQQRELSTLPPELRRPPDPVAVLDALPISADQLAGAINEEELGIEPATIEELIETVRRLPFEHSFLLLARLGAAVWHVPEDGQAQLALVVGFDMPELAERVSRLLTERDRRLVVFAEQYFTALQRLLIDHALPRDLTYEPTDWDLRSTVSAYFSAASVVSSADADLKEGEADSTRWLVYLLKNGVYNARPPMVNEFTRARELFAVIAPQLTDHRDFCPIDEWFVEDYGLTAAEQHAAGFAAAVLSEMLKEHGEVNERSLTAPPEWRGALVRKAALANDLLSAAREWYEDQFSALGADLDTIAWERRPFLRRPFLKLADGRWLLVGPRAIESWLGEGFLHRAHEAAERRGVSQRLRTFLGSVFEAYCLDLTRSVYPGERPPGGGRVHGEQPYGRDGAQLTSDVALDLGTDLVLIEVVARRLTQEMQVSGNRDVLERNLAPMLFQKIRQLGRVTTDVLAGTAAIPDVDVSYVERVWPVLVTAGELIQTEMLWEQIEAHTPDGLRAARVQGLTVLDIVDFELLLGLVADGFALPAVLREKNAGPYRHLGLSRFAVEELHLPVPLLARPPVMNERWETLAAEMYEILDFSHP
jgi:hypothetical protein